MTVLAQQIAIPSTGSTVTLFSSTPTNSSSLSIRNTGSVTVLLGTTGNIVFPLNAGEFLGVTVAEDDVLLAEVASTGTAGQISILGMN